MAIVITPGDNIPLPATGDRVYASVADLESYLGAEPPADAERLLARASEHLDGLLKYAKYDTDTTGRPTDTKVSQGVRLATCAQVEQWLEVGEDHPIAGYPSDTTISRSKVSESNRPAVYAPRAIRFLERAGLRLSLVA